MPRRKTKTSRRKTKGSEVDELLTLKYAADIIGCSRNSIYTYVNGGKKNCHGKMIRLRPKGSRDMFTTPQMIQDFLAKTFPARQVEKFENTLDYLESAYGIDTTQARSSMVLSAPSR